MPLFLLLTSLTLGASPVKNDFNVSLSVPAGKSRIIPVPQPPGYRIKTIVIDAGHGGKDPGCLGANSREKHIALAIAQSFARQLRTRHPDVQVILTRDDDTFIPLDERAAIANRAQADLFVSIHCNYMPGSRATDGSETYVMGLHTAQHNLDVAKRENESILLEEDYEKKYDYDPNSSEGHILLSLYQNVHLDQSILFANFVEHKIKELTGRRSRGVKQAGFVVLKETTMPSVLVEAGFLSSPKEEANLLSPEGQEVTALALVEAFGDYREFVESGSVAVVESEPVAVSSPQSAVRRPEPASAPPPPRATPPTARPVAAYTPAFERETAVAKADERLEVMPVQYIPRGVDPVADNRVPENVPRSAMTPAPSFRPAPAPVPVAQPAKSATTAPPPRPSESIAIAPTAYHYDPARTIRPTSPPAATTTAKPPGDHTGVAADPEIELNYAVQLAASSRTIDLREGKWAAIGDFAVEVDQEDRLYKYRVKGMRTYEAAEAALRSLRDRGFPDAFLVAFHQGQKLNQQQIKSLLGR